MKNEAETTETHETPEPWETAAPREPRESRQKRGDYSLILPLLGAGVLAVPSWFAWRWIQAFLQGENREQRLTLFMDAFPQVLQHPRGVIMFALVFAAAALLLGLAGRLLCRGVGKPLSAIVILGSLLTAIGLTLSLL